jgi:phosphoribosylanthranilate isomerase
MDQEDSQVWVKVCCISSKEEARLAIQYGAAALGLVSEMPSGPGVISEEEIAQIVAVVPPHIETFLLTSKTTAEEIIHQQKKTRASTLQLVDHVPFDELQKLRSALPKIHLVQVLHVRDSSAIDEALAVEPLVDGLLLDSGNPFASVKTLGGTGETHDWSISQRLVQRVKRPVFLAGGLRIKNVSAAIAEVTPAGLDICSGLRTNDQLDEEKLRNFMEVVPWRRGPIFMR